MEEMDRRSAFLLGLAAASASLVGVSTSVSAAVGDETEVAKGVMQKILGEGPAMIPPYKTVRLRDVIHEPGSEIPVSAMKNAMVCHTTQGELQVSQEGKTFPARTGYVWSCNTGTMEGTMNKSNAIAVMRVIDLLMA
jgi:hypothetical protein